MDFLSVLLIIIIILIISNCKKGGFFTNEWKLKSEKQRQKEIEISENNKKNLNLLLQNRDNNVKNNFNNHLNNFQTCSNRILGPVNEFHQKFKPLGREYGFRHWWKKNKSRNYVPKDYNFDGTSVRQYLDNLDNVNNVYCN